MAKAVLNCCPISNYQDRLPHEYHFVEIHRSQINKCYGDWVVLYETEHMGGRKGYVAVARIAKLRWSGDGHYYAILEDYRAFEEFVPHMVDGSYVETDAVSSTGRFNARRSVRFINDNDFDAIVRLGGFIPEDLYGFAA